MLQFASATLHSKIAVNDNYDFERFPLNLNFFAKHWTNGHSRKSALHERFQELSLGSMEGFVISANFGGFGGRLVVHRFRLWWT